MIRGNVPSARERFRASLDGDWSFWPDLVGALPTGPGARFVAVEERNRACGAPRRVRVPAPWQAQFDDLRLWAGTAWYERVLEPLGPVRGRIHLGFGAVDYFASVWVNGRLAGEHEGGYLPFVLDVTELIQPNAANTVTVRVLDVGPDDDAGPFPFAEIPHGKQSWYGPIGGIWQSVWLERRGETFVERIEIRADPASAELSARVQLGGAPAERRLRWLVLDDDGHERAAGVAEPGELAVRAIVPDPQPWSPGAPHLYELDLEVLEGDRVVDRAADSFGFRTVGVRDGRVVLNDEPVYLLGALDQDYWMGDVCTPGTTTELAEQMRRARELGLNLLRCHIKPPDPRYLDAADRGGVLVWEEPPSWSRSTEDARRRARETFEGMVRRDANHPSLVIRSIVNEDWGTDLATDPGDREWLRETYRWARSLDPTRLVVDNSACPPSFHVESDLNDFHLYRSVPEQTASWRDWTAGWVSDPSATYSPFRDASRRGSEPLILSEFGMWGLPDPEGLQDADGREPWWFETGGDTSAGIVRPAGVRERFDEWGLAEVFGSFEAFVDVSQRHEVDGLSLQIEDLRSHPQIAGYVVTEFTDVHWEANGLLDMRRRPKAGLERLRRVNAPDVVIALPERNRYRSGERILVGVMTMARDGAARGEVRWRLEPLDIGGSTPSGERIEIEAPGVEHPTRTTLLTRWVDGDRIVATNDAPIWLFPAASEHPLGDIPVATRWGDVEAHLRGGGRAVIVAMDEDALPADGAVHLEAFGCENGDASSLYGSGWALAAGMGWLSPALTRNLAVGPAVDLAFDGLTPRFVIDGYTPAQRADVLAGHYLGWLHRMRATVAAFAHGGGAGILCTFPLLGSAHADPLAEALVDRLRQIAAGAAFAPVTRLDRRD